MLAATSGPLHVLLRLEHCSRSACDCTWPIIGLPTQGLPPERSFPDPTGPQLQALFRILAAQHRVNSLRVWVSVDHLSPSRSQERMEQTLPHSRRKNQPCQHLGLGLLATRPGRPESSIVWAIQLGPCWGGLGGGARWPPPTVERAYKGSTGSRGCWLSQGMANAPETQWLKQPLDLAPGSELRSGVERRLGRAVHLL